MRTRRWMGVGLAAAGLIGCASDDGDWPVRPGGGGGGGGGAAGDAGMADGGTDGGTGEVAGLICVVDDLRAPDVCPANPARSGVVVRERGETTSVMSNDAGRFTLDAVGATALLIDVGDGAPALVPSRVLVAVGDSVVHAPVTTRAAWNALITAIGPTPSDGTGAIVAYTRNANGPVTGVVFDAVPGALIDPLYDNGAALAWRTDGGTGVAGVTLLLDIQPGDYTLVGTASDQRTVTFPNVSVDADRVTFVRGTLAP